MRDLQEAGLKLAQPAAFADAAGLHEAFVLLRREAPVHRVEPEGFNPFWAITKHADILEIERQHTLFTNAPRPVLQDAEADAFAASPEGQILRTLIHMDDPDHSAYRNLTKEWFQPRNLRRLEGRLAELASRFVGRMRERGAESDFVTEVAMGFPLHVIMSILGVPEADEAQMLKLTQELFGSADPDMKRDDGANPIVTLMEFARYFQKLTEDRRAKPTSDLASVIANGDLGGCPLGGVETFSYYTIVATAGHDTTSSAMAGGMLALVQHPEARRRLLAGEASMSRAVEEIIRWTTPVKHFMRTAQEDYELRGTTIARGDSVLLAYPSGNRDEEVFEDADTFNIDRHPNPHLAFGFGAHYCLGAKLARMELHALWNEILPRMKSVELAGEPALVESNFVSGLKRLPLRVEWAD
jgi:cytochrome P450